MGEPPKRPLTSTKLQSPLPEDDTFHCRNVHCLRYTGRFCVELNLESNGSTTSVK
jgi:hypothetical protein